MNNNTLTNSVYSTPYHHKIISVTATMQDIYHILMAIEKEGVPPEHAQAHFRLSEHYLHNWTIDGDFEYNTHTDGTWIIRKIKQYKPKPIKIEDPFVVEM